jgi:hypothetical protein
MMVFAQVGNEFYDFAIDQAWKIFNVLPLRDLVDNNGYPCTPLGTYSGVKPKLCRFCVMFSACVINNGTNPGAARKINIQDNCKERGTKAIHVGIPCYQPSFLCYIPSTGVLCVSQDVSFDENFTSTTAHHSSNFTGGIPNMPTSLPVVPQDHDLEYTGNDSPFIHGTDDFYVLASSLDDSPSMFGGYVVVV